MFLSDPEFSDEFNPECQKNEINDFNKDTDNEEKLSLNLSTDKSL